MQLFIIIINNLILYPITLIAFNRPYHTYKTLNFLSRNTEAKSSELFVFIDGPKNELDILKIYQTEKVIKGFKDNFKRILITRSTSNKGLALNVIDGITEVLKEYEGTIVLEDDIETSESFLNYMNSSLNDYKDKKKVWHISGYNVPLNLNYTDKDTFFIRVMFCWGWATWRDRWSSFREEKFSLDPYYLRDIFSPSMINEFNLRGNHDIFWSQIEKNLISDRQTWAIFWYSHIFLNKGLCLNPAMSLCDNFGFDGSGENCTKNAKIASQKLNSSSKFYFPKKIKEDEKFLKAVNNYFNYPNIFLRIFKKISRIGINLMKKFF